MKHLVCLPHAWKPVTFCWHAGGAVAISPLGSHTGPVLALQYMPNGLFASGGVDTQGPVMRVRVRVRVPLPPTPVICACACLSLRVSENLLYQLFVSEHLFACC